MWCGTPRPRTSPCGCACCRKGASAYWWVLDDGVGFDKHELMDGQRNERNVGLCGMIERTELGGGRLHIRSYPGKGVAVRAVLYRISWRS